MACAAALFPAIVWSGGQAGLDILESNSTLRKRNYLSEVKESGTLAHSTSPIHSALIPVHSLAGMKVHEESSHNHAVGGREPLPLYGSFALRFRSIPGFCDVSQQHMESARASLQPLLLPGFSWNQQRQSQRTKGH